MTHGEMNPCGEKHFVKGLFYIRNYILTPQTKASFFWTDSQWHWPVSMGTLARELPSGWGARPSPSPHPLDSRCAAEHAALELRPGAAPWSGFSPSLPDRLKGD